jgi:putative restriction endonuclease
MEQTIVKAAIKALESLKQASSIEDIRKVIDDNKLYIFGAQENNINSTIRNNIERCSENTNRDRTQKDKFFKRISPNKYILLEWENQTNFYWVNVGISKDIVKEEKFLWAPSYYINRRTGNQSKNAGWEQVKNVKKGDVIFCCYDKKIHYVAIAKENAYQSNRPNLQEFQQWEIDGNRIDVDIKTLDISFDINEIKSIVKDLYNDKCSPKLVTENNSINQQYMISLAQSVGVLILDMLGDDSIDINTKFNNYKKNNNKPRKKPSKTYTESLRKSRLGQGIFRAEVLEYWNETCPVTNVNHKDLLIASHILPWQLSNDEQKLDLYNGLALSPAVDKLFDKGFISFDNEGKILINKKINKEIVKKLGIDLNIKINNLTLKHKFYLEKHREIFNFNMNIK